VVEILDDIIVGQALPDAGGVAAHVATGLALPHGFARAPGRSVENIGRTEAPANAEMVAVVLPLDSPVFFDRFRFLRRFGHGTAPSDGLEQFPPDGVDAEELAKVPHEKGVAKELDLLILLWHEEVPVRVGHAAGLGACAELERGAGLAYHVQPGGCAARRVLIGLVVQVAKSRPYGLQDPLPPRVEQTPLSMDAQAVVIIGQVLLAVHMHAGASIEEPCGFVKLNIAQKTAGSINEPPPSASDVLRETVIVSPVSANVHAGEPPHEPAAAGEARRDDDPASAVHVAGLSLFHEQDVFRSIVFQQFIPGRDELPS